MKRFAWETRPKALEQNIVICGNARFTVLTPNLIRMEYDESRRFVDEASQTFFYRDFPKTDYSVSEKNEILYIDTEKLTLKYHKGEEFSKTTLSIKLKEFPNTEWFYGDELNPLKGTRSTLDGVNGETDLEDGICSRQGFAIIDDSKSALLSEDGWFSVRGREMQDLYFFGYGHKYLDCIADFYRLTGAPPLLPDYALGNWWSRFHRYTQDEYENLILRFENEKIPFSVAVIDMDWHITKIPAEHLTGNEKFENGWTGYSWNKELFPSYKDFLKFLKKHNLRTSLNLHPAQGVGSHEDMYEKMAAACSVEPKSKKRIKLDCLNKEFMKAYFDVLHHPYEEDGVDFWWMDWQQGNDYWWIHDDEHMPSKLEEIAPLWLLNHLHILDISRNGKRPMFFSRYCGLGSHRYPVGFSGDTIVTWESLNFQPYFTATASNSGYSWWSHDIGGHMNGYRDDELQVRWLQLGVFSPINRLHSGCNPFSGKEPWNLNAPAEKIAKQWLRFRHQLFPYIYTMNYRNHSELKPLIEPLYYTFPENDEAYEYRNQFWFGSELMVAPITCASDAVTGLASVDMWIPKGIWFDFFNGTVYQGEKKSKIHRTLEQYPVFAKAGAIVPIMEGTDNNRLGNNRDMKLYVFPGQDNCFAMYEDSGDGMEYKNGAYSVTKFSLEWGDKILFTIGAAQGSTEHLPKNRNWTVVFRGFNGEVSVSASIGGKNLPICCEYDSKTASTTVKIENVNINSEVVFTLKTENGLLNSKEIIKNRIFDIILHSQAGYDLKEKIWNYVCKGSKNVFTVCPEKQYSTLLSAINELIQLEQDT